MTLEMLAITIDGKYDFACRSYTIKYKQVTVCVVCMWMPLEVMLMLFANLLPSTIAFPANDKWKKLKKRKIQATPSAIIDSGGTSVSTNTSIDCVEPMIKKCSMDISALYTKSRQVSLTQKRMNCGGLYLNNKNKEFR